MGSVLERTLSLRMRAPFDEVRATVSARCVPAPRRFVRAVAEFFPSPLNGSVIGTASPSSVPEIDPATGGSVLSLVAGVLAMIEQRRRRRGLTTALTA